MRVLWWVWSGMLALGGCSPEPPRILWRLKEEPLAFSLTPQGFEWIEKPGDARGATPLRRFDLRRQQGEELGQGTFLRFLRRQEEGRLVVVEGGFPETPEAGPSLFPRARILEVREGRWVPLVEAAPFCVEALAQGERVFWVAVPPSEAGRFPYWPGLGQGELFLTEGRNTRHLASLEAPGGQWRGRLLGVWGENLYLVERIGLPGEGEWERLLRIHLPSGQVHPLLTLRGQGEWHLASGGVYGVAESIEAQNPEAFAAIFHWSPQGGLRWLTDWLPAGGRLLLAPDGLYFLEPGGLWKVPPSFGRSRRVGRGWREALAATMGEEGLWVFEVERDTEGRIAGYALTLHPGPGRR